MSVTNRIFFLAFIVVSFLAAGNASAEAPDAQPKTPAKPFRTFVTIQRYNMESNGETGTPISNVRLEITFPNGQKVQLPEGGQYWPIGNNQVQEINRTFEIPWAWVHNDAFAFSVKMIRKGSDMLPCNFDVSNLSQFNRGFTCHTDTAWQQSQSTPADQMDREGIQVRVFTDLNAQPKEIPKDAIALK